VTYRDEQRLADIESSLAAIRSYLHRGITPR
jgi:hypothetical protein